MSRGLPGRAGPVTQGYGGPPQFVIEAFKRGIRIRPGQSGTKRRLRELQEVIVWAKLIEVNDRPSPKRIEGSIRVHVPRTSTYAKVIVEHVSSNVRRVWDDLKIIVKRLR